MSDDHKLIQDFLDEVADTMGRAAVCYTTPAYRPLAALVFATFERYMEAPSNDNRHAWILAVQSLETFMESEIAGMKSRAPRRSKSDTLN